MGLDRLAYGRVGEADEALNHLRFGHHPAELREYLDIDSHREALGVHEDAVAVEDDKLDP